MLQLYAYDQLGQKWELDLYQEDPVKITISAEDIIDIAKVDSSFSRQFRIPATQTNSQFFKYWYTAGVLDFDVTKKVKAEIWVDGLYYRSGQLRLEGTFENGFQDNIELEIIFLGETKDFATQVGEGFINEINTDDTVHELNVTNVQKSWRNLGDPGILVGGKLRYILADRGYTYDGNTLIQPSEINGDTGGSAPVFVSASHPLPVNQFTPIIQVKYLIDKIFAETDYTYSSDSIFNEAWFKELYTDGLPEPSPTIQSETGTLNVIVNPAYPLLSIGVEQTVQLNQELSDPLNAFSTTTYEYIVPNTGYHEITALVSISDTTDQFGAAGTYTMRLYQNGTVIAGNTQTPSTPGLPFYPFTLTVGDIFTGTLNAGDVITMTVEAVGPAVNPYILAGEGLTQLNVTIAPATITASAFLKPDLKKIDFLRSVLTKFRCVMVPSKTNENQFIIKPWKDYIATGDLFDWTYKLDRTKDIQLQPVFFKQSAIINFTDKEDQDLLNKYHKDTFNYVYGRLLYDSQNELLQDTREVTTVFSPTMCDQVLDISPAGSNFIIPILSQQLDEIITHGSHSHNKRIPIKPKPKLMFWNGLVNTSPAQTWYYKDALTTANTTQYPRASYMSQIPGTSTTLNLNWDRQFAYFDETGAFNGYGGQSVFERYWKPYIDSLYSPEARLMTAYFTIDSEDLRNLTFDDVIFIKDSYWRVQKVYDAPLTDIASVKVDLIKLIDYAPAVTDDVITPGDWTGDFQYEEVDTPFDQANGGWGGTPENEYYELQNCVNPQEIKIGVYPGLLPPGAAVKLSGSKNVGKCFTVIAVYNTPQTGIPILDIYNGCEECLDSL